VSFHEWNHSSRIFVFALDIRVPFDFRSVSFPIFHFLVDLSTTARLEPTGRGFGAGGVEEQVTWKRACSS
jgi:hypothetical protein